MFRNHLCTTFGLLALSIALASTETTYADLITLVKHIDIDSNGDIEVAVDDENGDVYMIWNLNGEHGMVKLGNIGDNPNPEGGDSGLGPDKDTLDSMMHKQLQKGGAFEPEIPFGKTFLGKIWNAHGKGLDPLVNPPLEAGMDADNGGAMGGIDLNGGGVKDFIQKNQQQGSGKGDDDDSDNSSSNKIEVPPEWWTLVAPDLINPASIDKGFTLMGSPVANGGQAACTRFSSHGLAKAVNLGAFGTGRGVSLPTGPRAQGAFGFAAPSPANMKNSLR